MSVEPLPVLQGVEVGRAALRARRHPEAGDPSPADAERLARLFPDRPAVLEAVRRIVDMVRQDGDAALRRIGEAIDGAAPASFVAGPGEFERARAAVPTETVRALQLAADRVRRYHELQLEHAARSFERDGLGQVVRPLRRVGLYVPGTTAVYPSSVLHTAIPAVVAGVDEICITSPTTPTPDGRNEISPLKLVAAEIAGVGTVYKVGGAQAIAALAYGTESIPAVDKIFGPGSRWVTAAKRLVFGDVGIDAIYGPTETLIVADDAADPALCAADLLAQAEHDPYAAPVLITTSAEVAEAVARAVPEQAADLPRRDVALAAFGNRGAIIVVDTLEEALDLANEYAPEHLALVVRDPDAHRDAVRHAGGLFLGEASPEALADYVAGPSHVMPTGGAARFASPLHVGEFLKITTVVRGGDALLDAVAAPAATIAHAEGLHAHARSLERRMTGR